MNTLWLSFLISHTAQKLTEMYLIYYFCILDRAVPLYEAIIIVMTWQMHWSAASLHS